MQLLDALRLNNPPRLALMGSGDKTLAVLQLARQLHAEPSFFTKHKTVFLTTSTHARTDHLVGVDHHYVLRANHDFNLLERHLAPGIVLFTGPLIEPGLACGLSETLLDHLYILAQTYHLPLLVLADGLFQHPCKTPEDDKLHLPVWVDQIIVVASLSALGKPLCEDWRSTANGFLEDGGALLGDLLELSIFTKLLKTISLQIKSLNKAINPIALLTRADTANLQSASYRIADLLLPYYSAVLIASFNSNAEIGKNNQLPERVYACHERVAGIILAAGGSQRFGEPKQLLLWRGQSFVHHLACVALTAGLSPVMIITGNAASQVSTAVDDLPVTCLHNPDWLGGMSTSLVRGVNALPESIAAALIMLVDQPHVSVRLARSLIEIHARTKAPIVAPCVDGKQVTPVLFDRRLFTQLGSITGDQGGRSLLEKNQVSWLPWIDPMAAFDIDTPSDYQRLLDNYRDV